MNGRIELWEVGVSLLCFHLLFCPLNMVAASSFLPYTPGKEWKMVASLDMTDPSQQCPPSWLKITSPRSSCGKRSNGIPYCDSLNITTSGASYQTVCGRFRGYQVGSPDCFFNRPQGIEGHYVDGISITYGPPGNRSHVYTYAVGWAESIVSGFTPYPCPCAGGATPPSFVGSDYYCESGSPVMPDVTMFYSSDVLWDRQQCNASEVTCCNPPNLPWFCKNFSTPISQDLEVRICMNEPLNNENLALEFFELYIQVSVPSLISLLYVNTVAVFNTNNTLRHLEISWIPVENVTSYVVTVYGGVTSIGQGFTTCTSRASSCLYIHPITVMAFSYTTIVTSIKGDGTSGIQNNSTVINLSNSLFRNASVLNNNLSTSTIVCSFLNNQLFYCLVCCSTNPSVPPDFSMCSVSTSKATEVTVDLNGLTSGQTYYCKAAATKASSTQNDGSVVYGGVKVFFSFMTAVSTMNMPTSGTSNSYATSTGLSTVIGIGISVTLVILVLILGVVMTICVGSRLKNRHNKATLQQPCVESPVYEVVDMENKTYELETNSAYGRTTAV